MAIVRQRSFMGGCISPSLQHRDDLEQFSHSALDIRNLSVTERGTLVNVVARFNNDRNEALESFLYNRAIMDKYREGAISISKVVINKETYLIVNILHVPVFDEFSPTSLIGYASIGTMVYKDKISDDTLINYGDFSMSSNPDIKCFKTINYMRQTNQSTKGIFFSLMVSTVSGFIIDNKDYYFSVPLTPTDSWGWNFTNAITGSDTWSMNKVPVIKENTSRYIPEARYTNPITKIKYDPREGEFIIRFCYDDFTTLNASLSNRATTRSIGRGANTAEEVEAFGLIGRANRTVIANDDPDSVWNIDDHFSVIANTSGFNTQSSNPDTPTVFDFLRIDGSSIYTKGAVDRFGSQGGTITGRSKAFFFEYQNRLGLLSAGNESFSNESINRYLSLSPLNNFFSWEKRGISTDPIEFSFEEEILGVVELNSLFIITKQGLYATKPFELLTTNSSPFRVTGKVFKGDVHESTGDKLLLVSEDGKSIFMLQYDDTRGDFITVDITKNFKVKGEIDFISIVKDSRFDEQSLFFVSTTEECYMLTVTNDFVAWTRTGSGTILDVINSGESTYDSYYIGEVFRNGSQVLAFVVSYNEGDSVRYVNVLELETAEQIESSITLLEPNIVQYGESDVQEWKVKRLDIRVLGEYNLSIMDGHVESPLFYDDDDFSEIKNKYQRVRFDALNIRADENVTITNDFSDFAEGTGIEILGVDFDITKTKR